VIVTCAPCAANFCAIASPMPLPPPVINACFPCKFMAVILAPSAVLVANLGIIPG
jgi:hypothetical protein